MKGICNFFKKYGPNRPLFFVLFVFYSQRNHKFWVLNLTFLKAQMACLGIWTRDRRIHWAMAVLKCIRSFICRVVQTSHNLLQKCRGTILQKKFNFSHCIGQSQHRSLHRPLNYHPMVLPLEWCIPIFTQLHVRRSSLVLNGHFLLLLNCVREWLNHVAL